MSKRPSLPLRIRQKGMNKSAGAKTHFWMVAAILSGVTFLLWMNHGFIKPIAMAGLFASTLLPLSRRLEPKIPSATGRAALLTVGFAVTFILPLGIVAFLAADAGLKLVQTMPQDWTGQIRLEFLIDYAERVLPFQRADILRVVEQGAGAAAKALLELLRQLVSDLPKLTIDNIVIVLGLFVFIAEEGRILRWLRKASPLDSPGTERFFEILSSLAGSVVLATVASGLAQSLVIGAVCILAGVNNALLITMVAFVLSFIPVVGTLPVSLWLIGSSVFAGDWGQLAIVGVGAAVAGLSDNFVRPYVISGKAQLHPLIGFIAAFGALETMGFYGLFLGPVAAGAILYLIELTVMSER